MAKQRSKRSFWRIFLAAATLIGLVPLLVAAGLIGYLEFKVDQRDALKNQVAGLPLSALNTPGISSYHGPHPSLLSRAPDPFEYPIRLGQLGPQAHIYAGPHQYPFYCRTEESGLGQPLVDNQRGEGAPVYQEINRRKTDQVIGYTRDCLLPTNARYWYNREGTEDFFPLSQARGDIAKIEIDGESVDFIVRVETGTINRFIYVIAALKGPRGTLAKPDGSRWNRRLVYQFRGGVGIGRVQGRASPEDVLHRRIDQLRDGYAVIYSSANQTSNHYNIWLSEETALRVKRQFNALYGEDLYTVGIGGSGGAVQQYLIGQNGSGLIDAAIPLYSYPDMITQTTYVFDCELLEYYFDVTGADNRRWRDWEQRRLVEGMNALNGFVTERSIVYDIGLMLQNQPPNYFSGTSECVHAWRGLTPLVNNPRFIHHANRYAPSVHERVHWTYWDDLKYIFGTDGQGYARHTWDNVGVQYGLAALRGGELSPREFLHLNANVGSWKPHPQMSDARFWKWGGNTDLLSFSPWSHHNMNLSPDGGATPAPRMRGDIPAMEASYRSGQVFIGRISIPIVDIRHYLDDQLDMHHSTASFSTRQRMIEGQGHADNQLIWMTRKPHSPLPEAFELIDRWMLAMLAADDRDARHYKPIDAVDRCYDGKGRLIAQGEHVWDGGWNSRPTGQCSHRYPSYSLSRRVAGDSIAGDMLKCQLQPVEQAIERGLYGAVDMTPYLVQLRTIFPDGVCDYSRPDRGRPADLLAPPRQPQYLTLNPGLQSEDDNGRMAQHSPATAH
ncbi:DUF6351 family protein [Marinobacterium arenosum]|uniref:DUF6351 family protein n=1 Tax=Marinobacterium arenosum TaxID=2862496 RepID=UPI001C93C5B9|nr:DUF6351 family protein [Marinobacterium arenosum]MBY4677461.1 hypothetical protein [Marinobacterium arenosum]